MNAPGGPRRLQLEVEFEASPIQGRLVSGEGDGYAERSFSGWLGLMAAIESVRGAGGASPDNRKGTS